MSDLQLFAMTTGDPQPLPVPPGAMTFDELYVGLDLGVYSVLRTFEKNKFLDLAAHLARNGRSMQLLGWDYQLDETRLRQTIHQVCTASPYPEMRVRFDVLAAPAVKLGTDSRVLVTLMPFTPPSPQLYAQGVKLNFAPELSRAQPLAKTAAFSQARHAFTQAHQAEAYEYLLLDEAGFVLEGTGSNFYGVRDGVVYTAGDGVLEGITRRIILDLLPQLGIPLRLKPIHRDEIATLDEAAMSSSSRALLPVVEIDGQMVGNGRPGPVSKTILQAYNELVAKKVATAVS